MLPQEHVDLKKTTSDERDCDPKSDIFPQLPGLFVRFMSIDISQMSQLSSISTDPTNSYILKVPLKVWSASHSPPCRSVMALHRKGPKRMRRATPPKIPPLIMELDQSIFSNSTVSLIVSVLMKRYFMKTRPPWRVRYNGWNRLKFLWFSPWSNVS